MSFPLYGGGEPLYPGIRGIAQNNLNDFAQIGTGYAAGGPPPPPPLHWSGNINGYTPVAQISKTNFNDFALTGFTATNPFAPYSQQSQISHNTWDDFAFSGFGALGDAVGEIATAASDTLSNIFGKYKYPAYPTYPMAPYYAGPPVGGGGFGGIDTGTILLIGGIALVGMMAMGRGR